MNKNNFISYILILSVFALSIQSSSAKDFKFQVPFSRDCGLYGEQYDGISCRNALFEDIPICEEGEEIVSSPRRGRLCCCSRVTSEEVTDEGGTINDCRDVGCKNVGTVKGKECPSELEFYEVEGVIPCCCPPGKFEDKGGLCQIIECGNPINTSKIKDPSNQNLVCSRSELSLTGIKITKPTNSIYNVASVCCCPGGVAMIEAITCSNHINCRELTGPECTPSFPSFDEINIDQGDDGSIDRTFSCCCLPAKTE